MLSAFRLNVQRGRPMARAALVNCHDQMSLVATWKENKTRMVFTEFFLFASKEKRD